MLFLIDDDAGPRGARARTTAGQWLGPGGAGVAPVRIGLLRSEQACERASERSEKGP
eukprot:COSAG05_NODE_1389_length_5003_cov_4.929853_3_plen_57_part_00